jgi:ferrous iron transport protein A
MLLKREIISNDSHYLYTQPTLASCDMRAEAALESAPGIEAIALSEVAVGETVIICNILTGAERPGLGNIGLRLLELGFVEGETLRVVAHGFPGHEPIAIRIGNTTFALRRFEADHVMVKAAPGASA